MPGYQWAGDGRPSMGYAGGQGLLVPGWPRFVIDLLLRSPVLESAAHGVSPFFGQSLCDASNGEVVYVILPVFGHILGKALDASTGSLGFGNASDPSTHIFWVIIDSSDEIVTFALLFPAHLVGDLKYVK